MEGISVGHQQHPVQYFDKFASGKIQTFEDVLLNKEMFTDDHSLFDEALHS